MAIHFLYGRRESLNSKSEDYKAAIRKYLEAQGFAQTTDSSVEGSFEDMIYYNPTIDPGRQFIVEAKAGKLSVKNKPLARELLKYFREWQAMSEKPFKFLLFLESVNRPEEWELLFSKTDNDLSVRDFLRWYNNHVKDPMEKSLSDTEIDLFSSFLSEHSEVSVVDTVYLLNAASKKEETSSVAIGRMAKELLGITNRRRGPVLEKSTLIMNIIPIGLPPMYYSIACSTQLKEEIYRSLDGIAIPPFLLYQGNMISFCSFDEPNPLAQFSSGKQLVCGTKELQMDNPHLATELVNIHLRRIIWHRGIYRDASAEIFYYPMLEDKDIRKVVGPQEKERMIVKKVVALDDTDFNKKGDLRFYFHRGVELRTPTYWGLSFIEIIPRRYYTYNGTTPMDGEARAEIDQIYGKPQFDRGESRIPLMKLWKFLLFDSDTYYIPPDDWFSNFQFGSYLVNDVDWSPTVIGRKQHRLWDFPEVGKDA